MLDSWSGQTTSSVVEALEENKCKPLIRPKHTTSDLQPLDYNFNRQYKKLAKRIIERCAYEKMLPNITSREGLIRLHSHMWDQFSSPIYRDMQRYAWKHADQHYVDQELIFGPPPRMVQYVHFDLDHSRKCEVSGCSHRAFIRCSHNGLFACLGHFMDGKCSLSSKISVERDPLLAVDIGQSSSG